MIVDIFANADRYYGVHPRFAIAFEFIKEFIKNPVDGCHIPVNGNHIIDGDNIYAIVSSYITSPGNDLKWETHNRYMDLQFLISGQETIWWTNKNDLKPITEYNLKEDYTLYEFDGKGTPVLLNKLSFAILFPDDAHIPSQMYLKSSANRKIVIKIRY
jgi:biofilm protein TabA